MKSYNVLGDFNGDGKTDLLRKIYNTFYVYYSTGGVGSDFNYNNGGLIKTTFPVNSNTSLIFNSTIKCYDTRVLASDFNGDGKCDVVFQRLDGVNNKSIMDIYYSTGMGFVYAGKKEVYNTGKYTSDLVGDFDADGAFEILNKSNELTSVPLSKALLMIDFGNQYKERLLKKAIDGLGRKVEFEYNSLTAGGNFYLSGGYPANVTFSPLKNLIFPMFCVSAMKTPNGVGGENLYTYSYTQGIVHRQGKGFLGFKKMQEKDNVTNFVSETENYSPTSGNFYTMLPYKERLYLFGGSSDVTNTTKQYSFNSLGDNRYYVYLHNTLSYNNLQGQRLNIHSSYDSDGNLTSVGTDINSGYQSTGATYSDYVSCGDNPYPNYPLSVFEASSNYYSLKTKTTEFTYDNNCRLEQIKEFEGQENELTTAFTYDAFGHVVNTEKSGVSGAGTITLSQNTPYSTSGRFLKEHQIVGVGEKMIVSTNDVKWGKPTTVVNERDNKTLTLTYDAFGRVTKMKPPIQSPSNFEIKKTLSWSTRYNSVYMITTTPIGLAETRQYFDMYNRLVREEKTENGKTKYVENIYDAKGDLVTVKTNDADGGPITINNTYDVYHRLIASTPSIGPSTTNSYMAHSNGYTVVTNTTGQPGKSTTIDAAGNVTSVTDGGLTNSYLYNTDGNILKVVQNGKDLVVCTYDQYGNQIKLKDIDANPAAAGKENKYEYDAFRNITKQTDAKGNEIVMEYDEYGRMLKKEINDYNLPDNNTSEDYVYNALNVNAPGALKSITRTGVSDNTLNMTQEYDYDNQDRLETSTLTFESTEFVTEYTYGDFNRITSVIHPSVTSTPLTTNYTYSADGFITNISAINASVTKSIFTTQTAQYNAFDQVKYYTLGNNLGSKTTYNKLGMPTQYLTNAVLIVPYKLQDLIMDWDLNNGNLKKRIDASNNNKPTLSETFTYDAFNRLTGSTVGSETMGVSYNSIGNITSKFDAGTEYVYKSDKIHAVEKIKSKIHDLLPLPTGQAPSHPNNERSDISILKQEIRYNALNQPDLIVEGAGSALIKKMEFVYGLDGNRIKSIYTEEDNNGNVNAAKTIKRYYLGGYEFDRNHSNTVVRQINYISSPAGLVSMFVKETGNSDAYFFTYTDHLGSIVTVTNQSGVPVAYQNFDAWGRHRNPNNWTYNNIPAPSSALYRGFTGHEMLSAFDLVNMNGRLYDPKVGRMLSPDNNVNDPFNTQSYNRYSYVLNNPLKYTDPSGETEDLIHIIADPATGLPIWTSAASGQVAPMASTSGVGYVINGNAGQGTPFTNEMPKGNSAYDGIGIQGITNIINIASWSLQFIIQGLKELLNGPTIENTQGQIAANNVIQTIGNANKSIGNGNGVLRPNIDMSSATASIGNNVNFVMRTFSTKVKFLKPTKTRIGIGAQALTISTSLAELFNLKGWENNAFRHIFSYTAYYYTGMSESEANRFIREHELYDPPSKDPRDALVDAENNRIIMEEYKELLGYLDKEYGYGDILDYALEVISVMYTDGYYYWNDETGKPERKKLSKKELERIIERIKKLFKWFYPKK